MKCPNCGCKIQTPAAKWAEKRKVKGLCVRCGKRPRKKLLSGRLSLYCFQCLLIRASQQRDYKERKNAKKPALCGTSSENDRHS